MKMGRVALDGPQSFGKTSSDCDGFRKGLFGDLRHVIYKMNRLKKQPCSLSASRKSEHLLNNVRSALGANFHDGEDLFVVGRQIGPAQDGRSHQDWGQNVVQVVGHAAGE